MNFNAIFRAVAWIGLVLAGSSSSDGETAPLRAYIGTYTGGKSQGIYVAKFDAGSGTLSAPELAAKTPNPTFLAVHPNRKVLYAAGEIGDFQGKRSGSVSAFAIDPASGHLSLINEQPSGGSGPCHLAVDETGKCLLVANYGSGSIAALKIGKDGSLEAPATTIQHQGSSVNRQRQEGPHAHFIIADPKNRFVSCCDLGLDKVLVYKLNAAAASLVPNEPPAFSVAPGAGPRHLAFGPDGKRAYIVHEMGCAVVSCGYDQAKGVFTEVGTVSTLPEGFKGNNSCAEIQVHPNGKFVYASNRGHDSIAVFSADKQGRLSLVQHESTQGKTPRHFTLDPSGKWLLAENQGSDSIVSFQVDPKTGRLTPCGGKVEVGSPVCLVFAP